jgi:hypothetical protein
MTTYLRDQPIRHCKLSDLKNISNTERSVVRITGNVEASNTDSSELLLYNKEGGERFEVLVNLNYLDNFKLSDMHVHHDLVQFIGSRDFSKYDGKYDSGEVLRFKAIYFRFIRRTNLENYYAALQVQNNYLKI